jgi:hypothetical protein
VDFSIFRQKRQAAFKLKHNKQGFAKFSALEKKTLAALQLL